MSRGRHALLGLVVGVLVAGAGAFSDRSFGADLDSYEGLFETPGGRVRLWDDDGELRGIYAEDDTYGQIEGRASDGRIALEWYGQDTRGEGWIALGESGETFEGAWRVQGDADWAEWRGKRLMSNEDLRWLVVLEGDWEQELDAPDYAFGEMLEAYFRSNPYVAVRHRRFDGRTSLESLLRQAAFLPEPVCLVIAAHGEAGRLKLGTDRVEPRWLAERLVDVPNAIGVHLASCESMTGDTPRELVAALSPRGVVVSGYAESVDWLGAALIDLLYLDLVLNRDFAIDRVEDAIRALMPFAETNAVALHDPVGAAGFRVFPNGQGRIGSGAH
jgi:hypothetical protein